MFDWLDLVTQNEKKTWAEIHQALLSQFSILAEFFSRIVPIKDKDSWDLTLVNLRPGFYFDPYCFDVIFWWKVLRFGLHFFLVWLLFPKMLTGCNAHIKLYIF